MKALKYRISGKIAAADTADLPKGVDLRAYAIRERFESRTLAFLTLCSTLMVANAVPLKIVEVGAPAINCKFAASCTLTVTDSTDHLTLGGAVGDGFLQSRTWAPGETGTPAAGLHGYSYRLDLRQLAGVTALPCIHRLELDFGPVVPIDYDDDSQPDDVWVVTAGGLGSVGPSSAERLGGNVSFSFSPPVCAGASPGAGESTFFFGMSSSTAPRHIVASVFDTHGATTVLDARAPKPPIFSPGQGWPLAVILIMFIVGTSVWAVVSGRPSGRG